jgi:acyl-CoA synthetase (AMP-forming)/AMP-acid ligase II
MDSVSKRVVAGPDTGASTLVGLLRFRGEEAPERVTYSFAPDGGDEEVSWKNADVDRRARRIGGALQALGAANERVLLLYPPGLDFVSAFFGCLYAGATAVPAYPPEPTRLDRTVPRLLAILEDARPVLGLAPGDLAELAGELLAASAPHLAGTMRWVSSDRLGADAEACWRDPAAIASTVAMLQYTSGSTGNPKGVVFTHGNLLHNLRLIHQGFETTPESRAVLWLPPYHDMGLIGGILQPLYYGGPVHLMSPISFLKRPVRWLERIARTRATISGGPNFAYDLCVRKVTAEQRADLDLSSWDLAFSGSEPVRLDTMERFARTFAGCGFRMEAFYPCYGLAEATLIVTGGRRAAAPVRFRASESALCANRAERVPESKPDARELVGSGASFPDQCVVIVDPATGRRCEDELVGEIWVSGPSVSPGYWGRTEADRVTFAGCLGDDERRYLRTGDLGFMSDGELFITGRCKDTLVVRGKNHYPQDIERTVEGLHPVFRPGCGIAFTVPGPADERLVVVQEVEGEASAPLPALGPLVRRAVSDRHDLHAHVVVLVRRGTIPKTSSGKVRRFECRELFLAGALDEVERWPSGPSPE